MTCAWSAGVRGGDRRLCWIGAAAGQSVITPPRRESPDERGDVPRFMIGSSIRRVAARE